MSDKKSSALSLWIGVGVVFLLMAIAWTVMFIVASRNRPEDVPLSHREERN